MAVQKVKNKRLKMSPGGMITLSVAARKALAMRQGMGTRVGLRIQRGEIVLTTRPPTEAKTWRISSGGMMVLRGKAKALLANALRRHYWLKLNDEKQQVRIVPFEKSDD